MAELMLKDMARVTGLCSPATMATTYMEMDTSLVTMENGKERYQSVNVSAKLSECMTWPCMV